MLSLVASSAIAQTFFRDFHVVPELSSIQLDPSSAIVVDLPGPLGSLSVPLVPQTDPGVSGAIVPGVGLSDGTKTAMEGGINARIVLPAAPAYPGTLDTWARGLVIEFVDSGSWQPGPGGAPGPAKLAAEFGFPGLGLGGEIVLRDLAFEFSTFGDLSYVDANNATFPGPEIFPAVPKLGIRTLGGDVYFSGFGIDGGIPIHTGRSLEVAPDVATLTRIGTQDEWQITVPFSFPLDITISTPLSASAALSFSGTLVATTVPEPSFSTALLAGTLGVVTCVRRRSRIRRKAESPSDTRRARRRRLSQGAATLLGIAFCTVGGSCPPPGEPGPLVWVDADGDGETQDEDAGYYAPGEASDNSGATANATCESFTAEIAEPGQSIVSGGCSGGACTATEVVSTSCGAIEVSAEPKGFHVTIAHDCAAGTVYTASGTVSQSRFNSAGVGKSFSATLSQWSSDASDLSVAVDEDATPLAPLVPRVLVVPNFSASPQAHTYTWSLEYTADDGGQEAAELSVVVEALSATCDHDFDCDQTAGQICLELNQVCFTPGFNSFCENSRDCLSGNTCNTFSQRCLPPGNLFDPCSFDSDCNDACAGSFCTDGLLGSPCDEDRDCSDAAWTCQSGSCTI